MTFVTGSITSANPGPALYAALEPTLLAAGYTLDDTVVIAARTHKMLKSPAGANSRGQQWFLDFHYATTGVATGLGLGVFEDYTAATDQALRGPCSVTTSSVIDATTYSRWGAASSALETNWANGVSATGLHLTLVTATITYWASITADRVIILLSSDPTRMLYAGFYTPTTEHAAHAGADCFPLITTRLTAGVNSLSASAIGTVTASLTRMPKLAAFDPAAGSVSPASWADSLTIAASSFTGRVGPGGSMGAAVSPFTGKVSLVPITVAVGSANVGPTTPAGAQLGTLDGIASGYASAAATRGDTVTIDGVTWYLGTPVTYSALVLAGV